MNIFAKAVLALVVGAAAMAGAQYAWLGAIKQQVLAQGTQQRGLPHMKPAFADMKIAPVVIPKLPPIDTRAAEAAAISSMARQIDLQIRAANSSVPQPKTFPGMPRR